MPGINLPDPGDVSSSWTGRQIGALASARGVGRVWRWRSCRRSSPSPLPPAVAEEGGWWCAAALAESKQRFWSNILERDGEALGLVLCRFGTGGSGGRGKGVTVAVMDGEFDVDHPDLENAFRRDANGHVIGRNVAEGRNDVAVERYLCRHGQTCSSREPRNSPASGTTVQVLQIDLTRDACCRYHRSPMTTVKGMSALRRRRSYCLSGDSVTVNQQNTEFTDMASAISIVGYGEWNGDDLPRSVDFASKNGRLLSIIAGAWTGDQRVGSNWRLWI